MIAAIPALLALKLGTIVAQPGAPGPVLRLQEQTLVAASAGPQALVMRSMGALGVGHAPEWQDGPRGPTPFFRPYAPEEWITAVARGLNLSEGRVLDAARFVATMPVQVDVRARHVMVKVRVRSF